MLPRIPWSPLVACSSTAPGAVAEEHAGGAVGPVHVARQDLAADDEHVAAPCRDWMRPSARCRRVEEADAGRRDVGRRRPRRAPRLRWTRQDVAGNGMSPEIVPTRIMSRSSGLTCARFSAISAGPRAEVGEVLAVRDDVPLPDPGARRDPLVGGLDELLEVRVREDLLRDGGAGPDDLARGSSGRDCPTALREPALRGSGAPRSEPGSSRRGSARRTRPRSGSRS